MVLSPRPFLRESGANGLVGQMTNVNEQEMVYYIIIKTLMNGNENSIFIGTVLLSFVFCSE